MPDPFSIPASVLLRVGAALDAADVPPVSLTTLCSLAAELAERFPRLLDEVPT